MKSTSNLNVLVTSAGVMSAVNIIKSLQIQNDYNITIIAIDMDKTAPGLYLADYYYISPPVNDIDKYFDYISKIILKHNINVIFPCFSGEILYFSEQSDYFENLGAKMIIPSSKSISLAT